MCCIPSHRKFVILFDLHHFKGALLSSFMTFVQESKQG